MEYASFLAGERWSDHPPCTHGLLAGVARDVNDHISDEGRSRLIPLIPSVIGLDGDDPRIDVGIAARCAVVSLPVAAEFRQRALAAGLLAARRVLTYLDDRPGPVFDSTRLCEDIDLALFHAPHQAAWAEQFINEVPVDPKVFRRRSAPSMVRVAVTGIAEACIPDPDRLLYGLLDAVIADCQHWIDAEGTSLLPSDAYASSRPSRFS
jgi:hypothetical protein